jgi:hypothetical protein
MLLCTAFGAAADGDAEGDRKIRDTIEKAREAEERARSQRPPEPRESEEEDEGEGGLFSFFFELFFEVMLAHGMSLRFADYPYSPESEFLYNTSAWVLPDETKWLSLQLASDMANHFDGTWGNSNRLALQLSGVHIDVYNLQIFGESEWLSLLSVNGGLTFFVPSFLLSGFIGAYKLDVLEDTYLSFGFLCQVFLKPRLHLEVFNLNAAIGDQVWSHWQATAGLSLSRFSLGGGWHYNRIAGTVYSGPCLRGGFWL